MNDYKNNKYIKYDNNIITLGNSYATIMSDGCIVVNKGISSDTVNGTYRCYNVVIKLD